jgi:hypothetical protein
MQCRPPPTTEQTNPSRGICPGGLQIISARPAAGFITPAETAAAHQRDDSDLKGKAMNGEKLDLMYLSTLSLHCDKRYQRYLNESRARKMSENLDSRLFGTLLVASRNGDDSLWIIDGQHRWAAAKLCNEPEVACSVFKSDGPEHEARVFIDVNGKRSAIGSIQEYHSALFSGDPEILAIDHMVIEAGFEVDKGYWPHIAAAKALQTVYRKKKGKESIGHDILHSVLQALEGFESHTDEMKKVVLKATMIHMLGECFGRWGEELNYVRFLEKLYALTVHDWKQLEAECSGSEGSRGATLARGFIERYYNKQLTKKRINVYEN